MTDELESQLAHAVTMTARELLMCSRGQTIAAYPNGHAFCFWGWLGTDADGLARVYETCVGISRGTAEFGRVAGFISVRAGQLELVSVRLDDRYQVLPHRRMRLWGASAGGGFAIIGKDEEDVDEALTRQIFGATASELHSTLAAYALLVGGVSHRDLLSRVYPAMCYPRITTSDKRYNRCDLTGASIPRNFPFIAFCDTTFLFGHVSLGGFFRHLAFLCGGLHGSNGRIRKEMVSAGTDPAVLDRLVTAGTDFVFNPLLAEHVNQ